MSQAIPTPEITVSPVTSKEDFHSMVEVEKKAFKASPVAEVMFPGGPPSAEDGSRSEQSVLSHQKAWSSDPTARYLKACLPNGTIVGYAKWNFFFDSSKPQYPNQNMEVSPHANKEFVDYFLGSFDTARNKAMAGKKHFLMTVLCVHPEYQRLGIGGKLLDWGLKEADKEGLECWIDSSPFGLGLYKKHGWEEVGYLDIDLGRWGGEQGKFARTVHSECSPISFFLLRPVL